MAAKNPKEPKQRILDAVIALFAQKGFAGNGVREITKEANIKIAMISYYFEGKVGILKAVIEEFFDQYSQFFINHYSTVSKWHLWYCSQETKI